MAKNLIYSLTRGIFFIDRDYALAQLGTVHKILNEPNLNGHEADLKYSASSIPSVYAEGVLIEVEQDTWYGKYQLVNAPSGSSVVIPISGALMKNDYCYSPGTATLSKWIAMADRNPNIKSIILSIDSPGGDVSGTQTLADAIKSCKTPITAYVNDGYAASAAYWIASACDNIYVSHETSRVGSIGVMAVLANWEKHYREKEKLDIFTIYADQSSDKNKDVQEVLNNNDRPYIEGTLNKLAATFIETIKTNRGERLNLSAGNPFTGKMYFGSEALAIGLIDGIKPMAEIISSSSSSNQIAFNSNSDMKTLKISSLFSGILAFFNVQKEEGKTDYEVQASDEQLQELISKAEESIRLQAQVSSLEEEVASKAAALSEANSQIQALTSENQELKNAPGAGPHALAPQSPDSDPNHKDETAGTTDVDREAMELYNLQK